MAGEIEDLISDAIKTALKKLSISSDFDYIIEHPADKSHGDFATNVALATGQKPPRKIAQKIIENLSGLQKNRYLKKIEIAGAGFINFHLSNAYFLDQMKTIVKNGSEYGSNQNGKGKRVLVEYSSPNIAKKFGIGHLRSTIIGQAIYNIYKFNGWDVVGDNHLGDWGTQFGMIIAGIENSENESTDITKWSVNDFEDLYVRFNKEIDENPDLRKQAQEAFVRLEKGDAKARKIWQISIDISLKEFQKIYDKLGIKIDNAYGESFYEDNMLQVIKICKEKGIAKKSQGALIIRFDNMPPAILMKSDGGSTYFTRDLATIKFRRESQNLKSDLYVYEVGAEQKLHFWQLFSAAEMLGWGQASDYVHIAHGLMSLPEGKMSTRKGRTVKLEEIINEAQKKAAELAVNKSEIDYSEVAVGAIKYNDLKRHFATNYVFRWDEAINMEGFSGPYIQYTYARALSVLKKSQINMQDYANLNVRGREFDGYELFLAKNLSKFSEVVIRAAEEFAPHYICSYLFELAQSFNSFYNKNKIVGSPKQDLRLVMTKSTSVILRNGLGLLGIEAPGKM